MSKRATLLVWGLMAGCQMVAGLTDREAGPSETAAGSGGSSPADGGSSGATTAQAGGEGGNAATPRGGEGGYGARDAQAGMGGEGAVFAAGGEGGGGGVVQKCTPNEPSCTDNTAVVCNAEGTDYLAGGEECTAQQTCVAGACAEHECVPSTTFCSGNSLRSCAEDGLSSSEVTLCGANQYCDTSSASCKNGVCAPNQPACDENRATTCNADGSAYTAGGTTCNSSQSCDAGVCKTRVCDPGSTFCQGQDLKTCSANGLSSSVEETCSANRTCVVAGASASCTGVCGPGQVQCTGNSRQQCSPSGQWGMTTACQTSKFCSSGVCVSCPATTLNCDTDPENACEVELDSPDSCGTTCANVIECSTQHGTASCSNATCGISCTSTYANCGGTNDGCETDLATDPNNCDACGRVCSASHMATRTCGGRSCNGNCAAGYSDCDSNKQTNGCEKHTDVDPNFCGDCNTVCKYRVCESGSCVASVGGNDDVTAGPTTTKLAKNTLWAMRINVVPTGVSSTLLQALGMAVVVNVANPAANIRLGLYTDSGGSAPNTLEAQTPAFVTTNGLSEQLLASAVSIPVGAHWFAFVADQDVRVHVDAATVSWTGATLAYASLPASYPLPTAYTVERGHVYAVTTP
ncbi:MAG TPA: hypothetical protein VEX18_19755 [Polyangiaceae bacterium]|nr:hypothetical protein [Polyangiaceae bacterium]